MLWKVGDKVWLETPNLHMNGPKKLQMKQTGPFKVEQVISHMAFCLQIPSQMEDPSCLPHLPSYDL